ncbi:MAG TPA: hypothetical protein ENJ53_11010 [Phaeodactylibacter sp.]|nr:hypothetical protein [Phaeodactylibacter sp.]
MNKKLLPAIFWAILIFYFSGKGSLNLPESIWDILSTDKVGHFGIYGIFTFLLLNGLPQVVSIWQKKEVRIALIISILYGISMEIMQYLFFPSRYFEFLDIIANIIGSFTGLYFFKFFNKKS